MEICVAKNAGFCYGVRRAVNMALSESEASNGAVCTLGEIIHNKSVIEKLTEKNVRVIENAESAPDGATVIIRAHGVGKAVYETLERNGCKIVDATCPHVAKIHQIVERESKNGKFILIIGVHNHPEAVGTSGWCSDSEVVENFEELQKFIEKYNKNCEKELAVVAQTTSSKKFFEKSKDFIKKTCKTAYFFDTICNATEIRQSEAENLSAVSDLMLVIGDKTSANSRHLAEICRQNCKATEFIENADEIKPENLTSYHQVGVTAGASTPEWIIKEVLLKMSESVNTKSGESFEELLEQSLKTLHRGEKVKGTVTAITGNEVYVDLGVKCAGVIPSSEMSVNPSYRLDEDNIKVGDEIEAIVVKINDEAGVISLSKRLIESQESWNKIEEALENKTVLEGVVTEENKGGVVAVADGIKVFIPLSRTGLKKGEEASKLIKQTVKFVIKEINKRYNKVVGSMRELISQERREQAEKFWNEIEVGKEYTGKVKTITSFGAFVDLGGADGMVHITELSWKHINKIEDAVKVGDELHVRVLAVDKDAKRISLTCKNEADNPWTKFEQEYKVGMTVNVTVRKLVDFGAFAEIIPGVDGLIHISQISTTRIESAGSVLKLGQKVDAKIIDIDSEKKRVSLSIRALLENYPDENTEEAAEQNDAE